MLKTSKSQLDKLFKNKPPLYDYEKEIWSIYHIKTKEYVELSRGVNPQNYYGISKPELVIFFKEGYKEYPGKGRDLESWCIEDYTSFASSISKSQSLINQEKPPLYDKITKKWAYYNNAKKIYIGNFSSPPDIYYGNDIDGIREFFKSSYSGDYKGRGYIIEDGDMSLSGLFIKNEYDLIDLEKGNKSETKLITTMREIQERKNDDNFCSSEQEEMVQIPKSLFDSLMKIAEDMRNIGRVAPKHNMEGNMK